MRKYKLGNIAEINFGPHQKYKAEAEVKYLLASHFNKLYQPEFFKDSFLDLNAKTEKYLLQKNDLLLTGKGNNIFAWAYSEDFGKTIASSLFYVIKTNPNLILNEYLAYYLNTSKMIAKLKILGSGATVLSIPKKELFALTIEIPSLEEQKHFIEIANTSKKNIELTKNILHLKTNLHQALVNRLQ